MPEPTGDTVLEPVWLVEATYAPDAAEVRAALERLSTTQAFVASARYGPGRAEVRYWDEADTLLGGPTLSGTRSASPGQGRQRTAGSRRPDTRRRGR